MGNGDAAAPAPPAGTTPGSRPAFETAQRIGEAVTVAAVSSAGLYLVGTVYTDAYYGRLAIEVTSLDLAPAYVALQSVHALWGLLEFPLIVLVLYGLYRTLSRNHRFRAWDAHARQRFPRVLPVLTNLVVVASLLIDAYVFSFQERELPHRSVLTEVTSVLGYVGVVLLAYVIWLGWSQRRFLLSEIQARKVVPITLVFLAYLLGALATTALVAELAAVELLTGVSRASLRVEFVTKPGVLPALVGKELLLVTARNGAYYVVENEPSPPDSWATSYIVPFTAVDAAQVRPFHAPDPTVPAKGADGAE